MIFSCQPLSFLYNLPCPVCCVRHTWAGDHPRVTLHQCWASSDPASHWSLTPNTGLWLADWPTLWRISIFGNISRHSGEQIVSNKWFCAMFLFCQTPHCLELSCNPSVDQSEASIETTDQWEGGNRLKRGGRDVSRFMWGNYQSPTQTIPRQPRLTTQLASHWSNAVINASYWSLTSCVSFVGLKNTFFEWLITIKKQKRERGDVVLIRRVDELILEMLVNGLKLLTAKLLADA